MSVAESDDLAFVVENIRAAEQAASDALVHRHELLTAAESWSSGGGSVMQSAGAPQRGSECVRRRMDMPKFLIERRFGHVSPDDLQAGGSASKRVAAEKFPEIVWEHSHAVETGDGLVTYCVYQAPSEAYVRDHAAAAGLPCDQVHRIANTVGPGDFA